ncbi:Disease resistance protein (CC-NBS-LRR class) family protein [Rhynchospora pubera]|uniref:Disease resistance protein (CC-NBS-LRR class) family protein n=1 Tax=Rhynchospora pubera TaxID=906938 RepID=A0AAV8CY76_9POAL|nr:Disease resistance protein (CC-NBS-LRR class) family protein [Rhynchospora pubera]
MTEAIIAAAIKKLADVLIKEACSLHGVDGKISEVKLQLGQMQRFLKDANSKSKGGDERVKAWVSDVRSVAYETEDAIDKFLFEAIYLRFGFIPSRILARRTLGQKIYKIQAKLRIISESRTTFGIQEFSQDRCQPSFKRHVLPDVDKDDVVGLEDQKQEVIDLLLHRQDNQIRLVVTIVGPGGLGKTTLAQKVYSSSTVKSHFDLCLWITVSKDFNLVDILKKMHQKLAGYTEVKGETEGDKVIYLLGEVNVLLKMKKYLIVLDDVWSEDVFIQLETGLVDIGNGNRVLMTIRFLNVANRADSTGVYHLRFLNESKSLELFLKKALQTRDPSPECPDELLDLARKLVKRCDGLPLALIVLGGLLSIKPPTHRDWSRMVERLDWHIVGRECMEILATSYDDLPYFLKSCFRCLVQVAERTFNGAIKTIRVHDLLREVALCEAKENDFLVIWKENDLGRDVNMTRRIAFHEGIDGNRTTDLHKDLTKISMPKLRTFLNFNQCIFIEPDSLEILGIEGDGSKCNSKFPTWIGHLHLQTFDIRGTQIRELPEHFWEVTSLRHVHSSDIYEFDTKIKGPPATANLNNLRSIGRFLVSKSWNKSLPHIPGIRKLQLRCQVEDDGKLIHNLLSKLSKLLSVRLDNFYPPQNIIDLSNSPSYENIHTLFLSGYETIQIAKLPPNLTKLTLSSFLFMEDPMPTLAKLCSLKSLEMNSIRIVGGRMVCSSGGFPRLQNLKLDDVLTIIIWNVEYGAFPMLKYLDISACYSLNALPDLRYATNLQELRIDAAPF